MEASAISVQLGITVFSGLAAWLTNDCRPVFRKWAPVFGLASQPFWIASAIQSAAWGVLIISAWYTYCWMRGIYNNWLARWDEEPVEVQLAKVSIRAAASGLFGIAIGMALAFAILPFKGI